MQILEELRTDARFAIRTLRREPLLALGVIVTFALAIGANAAMFGLLGRLLLSAPPGVGNPGRVARIELLFTGDDGERYSSTTTSMPVARALSAQQDAFTAVAAVRAESLTLDRGASMSEVAAIEASGEYWVVLGVRPRLGRFWVASEDAIDNPAAVVVLSHAFWKRRFSSDASILGREIILSDRAFTIIGVAPAEFTGDQIKPVDVFVPISAALANQNASWSSDTRLNFVSIVARLREGVQPAAAEAAAAGAAREALADGRAGDLVATRMTSLLPGTARGSAQGRTALWLSGVALIVLLIATANVGTLLLLRALRRRREIAVRLALGVGRLRLARQLVTESLMLASLGGIAGVFVSSFLSELIRLTLLPNLAPADRLTNPRLLAGTALVSCVVGLLAGVAPLLSAGRRDIVSELRSSTGGASAGRSPLGALLVTVQIALCTLLLAGAGLFVRSLQRVEGQDLGFSTSRLLLLSLDFRANLSAAERDAMHMESVRRLMTLPGVTGATVIQSSPFGSHNIPPISIAGQSEPPMMGQQLPIMYGATPEYLRLMGVKLRRGRTFTDRDVSGAPLVVLVNESMAKHAWPGASAIGQCIRVGFDPTVEPSPLAPASLPCREVVGIVADSRARSLRADGNEGRLMQYYIPFGQLPEGYVAGLPDVSGILVQTADDPQRLIGAVQRLVQGTATSPVFARVRPYQTLLDPQLRPWRLGATLFSAFGMLALVIASVGLFGVVSYLVTQRTREIGVRLALGGTRAGIGRLVILDSLRVVLAGIGAGLLIVVVAAPLAQTMLFQTSARDATVLTVAGLSLIVVSLGAAVVPAWRAARLNPLIALRAE